MKTTNFLLSLDPELDKDIIDYLEPFKKKKKGADEVRKAMRLYMAYKKGEMQISPGHQSPSITNTPVVNQSQSQDVSRKPRPFVMD